MIFEIFIHLNAHSIIFKNNKVIHVYIKALKYLVLINDIFYCIFGYFSIIFCI